MKRLGQFVTARLAGVVDSRQGVVIRQRVGFLDVLGELRGDVYSCTDEAATVADENLVPDARAWVRGVRDALHAASRFPIGVMEAPAPSMADEHYQRMLKIGRSLKELLAPGWGFVLVTFTYGEKGRSDYMATASRVDSIRFLREMADKLEQNQ